MPLAPLVISWIRVPSSFCRCQVPGPAPMSVPECPPSESEAFQPSQHWSPPSAVVAELSSEHGSNDCSMKPGEYVQPSPSCDPCGFCAELSPSIVCEEY